MDGCCTSWIALPDADAGQRRDRLDAALRSHAAAHRPARAVGGVRSPAGRQDRELSSRRRVLDHRPGARAVRRPRSRAPRTRPTASSGKIGRWRFASPGPRKSATLALRKEPKREGTLRLIDVAGVRSVGLRRHARRANRRDRAHRRRRDRAVPRRLAGRRFSAAAARSLAIRALRDAVAGSVRALSVLPAELPAAIERLQADSARSCRKQVKDFQIKQAGRTKRTRWPAPRWMPAASSWSWRRCPAGMPNGLKAIASRIVERPGYVAVLVGEPAPAPIVVARAAGARDGRRRAAESSSCERHGGKGGGRPEMAQGGGVTSAAADVLQSARDLREA